MLSIHVASCERVIRAGDDHRQNQRCISMTSTSRLSSSMGDIRLKAEQLAKKVGGQC